MRQKREGRPNSRPLPFRTPATQANRRSSAKVLMTEPVIDHAVKEILGARVVYVFAFLHLAR